jgi:ketosteroid isomerase-like protein
MSQENVEVVERLIAAVNDRDVDAYLDCCAEGIRLATPAAPLVGDYVGEQGIRRFFAEIEELSPDFHLDVETVEAIGERYVLASVRLSATGRSSGAPAASATPMVNVYEFVRGRLERAQIFADRSDALEAVGLRE